MPLRDASPGVAFSKEQIIRAPPYRWFAPTTTWYGIDRPKAPISPGVHHLWMEFTLVRCCIAYQLTQSATIPPATGGVGAAHGVAELPRTVSNVHVQEGVDMDSRGIHYIHQYQEGVDFDST